MKKLVLIILPALLFSGTLQELLKKVDSNLLIKSKKEESLALEKLIKSKKSKEYPSVDLSFDFIRLNETPTTVFHIPSFPTMELPVGTKSNLSATLSVTYPLFTGYAITNSIKKAELKFLKSKLETKNLKRELYIKTIFLYSYIYSSNMAINATKKALDSIKVSYQKAKGLYDNGLLNPADLYNIEAKKYEITSTLEEYKQQKNRLLEDLAYITGEKVDVQTLPSMNFSPNIDNIIDFALKNREDLKALNIDLKISSKDILLAKSKKYPQIALFGAIKREGDNLRFNSNDYTNADKSYIGAKFEWNIFDGYEKESNYQAAIIKKNATKIYINDYKRAIIKEIKKAFSTLKTLNYKKISAKKEVEALTTYNKLIQGRFENSLSSADELSRSIANLAKAKAKLQNIEAQIFIQKSKILLLAGNKKFKEYVPNL